MTRLNILHTRPRLTLWVTEEPAEIAIHHPESGITARANLDKCAVSKWADRVEIGKVTFPITKDEAAQISAFIEAAKGGSQ